MELIGQTIANAIVSSAFYALLAVGLSLVFGVMQTANYAHGEFYMLGAYVVWLLYAIGNIPFLAAVGVSIILVGLLGIVAERVVFRPVRSSMISGFIISVGLVFILQVFVGQVWGVGKAKTVPVAFPGVLEVFGITVSWQRLVVVLAALLLLGLFWFFLSKFRLGRALRASALDNEAASLQGISNNRMTAIAMFIGSAMAGAAGGLMAPIVAVSPYMGEKIVWTCFIIVIIGGAGNIKGTILASIVFGFLITVVTTFTDSTIANLVSVVFMLIFLAIRPQGLVGYAEK